ncbi:MAG: ATP-dependent sacrificial sulfur transferase LarE [Burkholderiaceae bacterium]|jgi:uncharacterized protein|nr:ATP-dependent sacrificial sulfur transferase LarE [Burkholderiaceae bacterium]
MNDEKQARLHAHLHMLGKVVVAFSGGVDSTFLLQSACDALGKEAVIAVTGCSLSFPQREVQAAQTFTRERQITHFLVDAEELAIDGFADNPPNRCYLCKHALFDKIRALADEKKVAHIVEASNVDDEGDYRPGLAALDELHIISPLRKARLTKADIRALSKAMGLPTWNKPSFACLASRFPYGERIDAKRLQQIDSAEQFLLSAGFRQVRVRLHEGGKLARIELDEEGFALLSSAALRQQISEHFKELGFTYTALDLLGYRTGSMNEILWVR